MGFFDKLKEGLMKTKNAVFGQVNEVIKNFRKVDESLLEELEEIMICADMGTNTTEKVIEELRDRIKTENIKNADDVKTALCDILVKQIGEGEELNLSTTPSVILVIGVNGVGKTTSIGKIANNLRKEGKKVIVAAADTFRAAAIDQLAVWCDRAGVELIRQNEGADPASVVYDAIAAANKQRADVLIIDTAGRLHNKSNLMNELAKINRIITRELPDAAHKTVPIVRSLCVRDAELIAVNTPSLVFFFMTFASCLAFVKSAVRRRCIHKLVMRTDSCFPVFHKDNFLHFREIVKPVRNQEHNLVLCVVLKSPENFILCPSVERGERVV